MLASAFKTLGASLLAAALIWALVLGWWQGNDHTPATTELFLYLGALPLSIVGSYWLLRGFIDHVKAPASTNGPAPDAPLDPQASQATKMAAAERTYTINLIDAFALSGGGDGPAEIMASLAAGKRPTPDASLIDDAGFPVFAAGVYDIDLDGFAENLAQDGAPLARALGTPEHLRMLALIDSTLPAGLARAHEELAQRPPETHLSLIWLIPSGVDQTLFPELRAWLQTHYLSTFEPSRITLSLKPAFTEFDVMTHIDHLILETHRGENDKDLSLIVAAVSAIGASTVNAWSAQHVLFSADDQSGQIPGECAVCLLFGAPFGAEESLQLTRIGLAERDKPVEAGGRIKGALLEQLIAGLLSVHDLVPADIKNLVSDADHRQSRVSELLDALGDRFSDLDPIADCRCVGATCGTTAPFGALLALACASAQSLVLENPVICVSQQHPTIRSAVLLRPTPRPTDGPSVNV